jgi:biotin synthase
MNKIASSFDDSVTTAARWTTAAVQALFAQPFNDLLFQAQTVHRQHFDANSIQISTLLSIKTGACPEDCKYCPQSTRYDTGLKVEPLMALAPVLEAAARAKAAGATRFCMGAAWRSPKNRDMPQVVAMVEGVKALGLETCLTLGMLSESQSATLATAGLDYYNHNLDTSPEYYGTIISTRTYDDRLATLAAVAEAGIKVCSGGIVGMGENQRDRAALLVQLANLPQQPESVPINKLVRVEGTPMANIDEIDDFDFIRTIAVARILMPKSSVRLSAGRDSMSEEMHALAYLAGANSIFCGEKLLTTALPESNRDMQLLQRLGIKTQTLEPVANEHQDDRKPQNVAGAAARFVNTMPL